eukprot:5811970-Prymnesium_polylepis.1
MATCAHVPLPLATCHAQRRGAAAAFRAIAGGVGVAAASASVWWARTMKMSAAIATPMKLQQRSSRKMPTFSRDGIGPWMKRPSEHFSSDVAFDSQWMNWWSYDRKYCRKPS